jgi:flagellar hook-associated protein 3 FlgL
VYSGDQGVRTQRISESRVVQEGDSGAEVFGRIRSGNGTFNVLPAGTNAGGVFYSNTTVTDVSAWDHQQYVINFTAPDTYEVRDGGGTLVTSGAYESGNSIEFSGIAVSFEGDAAAGDSFTIEPSRYQSVFQTVDDLLSTLGSSVLTDAQQAEFQSNTNAALLNLDRALDHISEVRGSVGQRLSVLDQQQEANDRVSIEIQSVLSRTQDTDLASLISELEAQSIALEAAQRSYARLQGQSLFDLI